MAPVFGPVPASAQATAPNTPPSVLEEITVTARKREESLQATPISITAFSGESLEKRAMTRIDQIESRSPNLVFQNNPSFGGASSTAAIYLRGVGQKEFLPTTEPGVGLYLDGVYIARSVGAILDLVDVERIEVLRGPQGTLFGRNTIGGAISVVSKEPGPKRGFSGSLTTGRYGRLDVKASGSFPLGRELTVSLGGARIARDGYVVRVGDDRDLGDENKLAARMQIRWLPSDNAEISLSFDGTRARENGPAMELLGVDFSSRQFNPSGLPLLPPGSPPSAGAYATNPPFDAPTDNFALLNNYVAFFLGGQPCLSAFGQPYDPQGSRGNPACYSESSYVLPRGSDAGTARSFSDLDLWGTSLTIDWTFGGASLRSISAYRHLDSEFARDGDHSPLTLTHFFDSLTQKQFSQELQLQGLSTHDRLNWITGLYWFIEEGNNVNLLEFTPVDFRSGGDFRTDSYAAFAQASYDLSDAWSFTGGLRFTRDRKSFFPDQVIFANRTPDPSLSAGTRILPPIEVDDTFSEWTPMINAAYEWNPDFLGYVSVSRGFKSGGFVQRVFPPLQATPSFEPETATVYEVGAKWTSAGGSARINSAIFYTDYTDLQIQVFTAVAPVTKNAASARIAGMEVEALFASGSGWQLELGAGFLDPKFKEVDPQATEISAASELERISRWSLNAGLSRSFALDSAATLEPRIDACYRSKFYNDALNTEPIAQESYTVVDASVAWSSRQKAWIVQAGLRNALDEEYLQTGIFGSAFRQYEVLRARPREWFLALKANL